MPEDVERHLATHSEVGTMPAGQTQVAAEVSAAPAAAALDTGALETSALEAYRRWDAEADPDERAALDALAAQDDDARAAA